MLEREIENYLKDKVEKLGGEAIKLFGIAGIPDRMILLPGGKIYFVELKRPGEHPRPLQKWWIKRLKSLGFVSGWCNSKESVDRLLGGVYDVQLSTESCRKDL